MQDRVSKSALNEAIFRASMQRTLPLGTANAYGVTLTLLDPNCRFIVTFAPLRRFFNTFPERRYPGLAHYHDARTRHIDAVLEEGATRCPCGGRASLLRPRRLRAR